MPLKDKTPGICALHFKHSILNFFLLYYAFPPQKGQGFNSTIVILLNN